MSEVNVSVSGSSSITPTVTNGGQVSVSVVGSTTINPTVGNGDTVNVTVASVGATGPAGAAGAAGAQGPAGPAGTTSWNGITDKPATFTPSSHSHAISDVTGLQTALDGKQASGTYATLVGGTVPSTQLPSYVDDVLEFAAVANFPATGESGKIYVATGTGKVYRWSGSAYVEIIGSPGSTDAVPEGSVNLYYTAARAAAAAPVQSVNGLTGAVVVIATYAAADSFPATGQAAMLYVETDTGRVYQWTGSVYAETGIDSAAGQHASQHGAAGSDPITIATSQITGFSAAAAAAAPVQSVNGSTGAVTVSTGKPLGLILALT
jgi:hypothetical protein